MDKRKFKFYMNEPETGDEYSFEENISDWDCEFQEELDYLLEQFKNFLKAAGYGEMAVSHLQYLDDEEHKYVLQRYGEWNEEYERIYQARKG